jgi:hypothetical protein
MMRISCQTKITRHALCASLNACQKTKNVGTVESLSMTTKAERLRKIQESVLFDGYGDARITEGDYNWLIQQVEATIKPPKTRSSDGLEWRPNNLEGSNALNVLAKDRNGNILGFWATYIPKGCHVRNALRHFKESHPKVDFYTIRATLEKRGQVTYWSFDKEQL